MPPADPTPPALLLLPPLADPPPPLGAPPLLPLLGRPFAGLVLERLAWLGFTKAILVCPGGHEPARRRLEARYWGLDLSIPAAPAVPPDRPLAGLAPHLAAARGPLLVGRVDRLPPAPLLGSRPEAGTGPVLLRNIDRAWSGWAWLGPEAAPALAGGEPEGDLARLDGARAIPAGDWLEAGDLAAWMEAGWRLLEDGFPDLAIPGRQIRAGVWLGAGARVYPSASLIAPVWLGPGVVVRRGARLGPRAMIGRGSLVDRRTQVSGAAVLPGSYVGRDLELKGVVVDRERLIDPAQGTALAVGDDYLLDRRRPRWRRPGRRPSARAKVSFPGAPSDPGGLVARRRALEMLRAEAWLSEGKSRLHPENLEGLPRLLAAGLRLTGLHHRGLANALDLRLTRVEIPLTRLSRDLDGLSLLFLADLHADGLPGLTRRVVDLAAGLAPDLVLLGGDYRFDTEGPSEGVRDHLTRLIPRLGARLGVYACLGNHDAYETRGMLEGLGARVLLNQGLEAAPGLWLAGVDDPHFYGCDDLRAALAGAPPGAARVLLCHSPGLHAQAAAAGVDLYLCGHTHGGQICLPGGTPLIAHTRAPRRLWRGRWSHQGMAGYTTTGAGCVLVTARFNCPPELAWITLRRG